MNALNSLLLNYLFRRTRRINNNNYGKSLGKYLRSLSSSAFLYILHIIVKL